MIAEFVGKEIIRLAYKGIGSQFKKLNIKLSTAERDLEDALDHHIRSVKNWSSEVNFKDLQTAKNTQNIYIQLNLFLYPRRVRISEIEEIPSITLLELLEREQKHMAILGQPGAGKTTSMKYICQKIFYDETFQPSKFKIPILVKLRDFNKISSKEETGGIVIDFLFDIFGLRTNDSNLAGPTLKILKEKAVIEVLEKTNALLIVEGFDELSYKRHRDIVIDEIYLLANHLEQSKMIITSRSADFVYSIENVRDYEFCSLNEEQINEFARKWLSSQEEADNFLTAIATSPFADTTIRPLTIAHLCAIYERIGKIPEKPKTVYKRIINLLLEEWDEQRHVKRVSRYGSFETDRKFEFLSAMAYHLTVSSQKSIFSTKDLINTFVKIHYDFDLKKNEGIDVVAEVESHSGLFIQAGFEFYEFAHKSLQEYLTAEYLVKLPAIPQSEKVLKGLANELAIAIAISSNPSQYFIGLIQSPAFDRILTFHFLRTFINRLVLEKPDFNRDPMVIFSALSLYTSYLDRYIKEDQAQQLNLFVVDDLVPEFEKFVERIFARNYISDINRYYDVKHELYATNGSKIIHYRLKPEINKRLPNNLYCRADFLQSTVPIVDSLHDEE